MIIDEIRNNNNFIKKLFNNGLISSKVIIDIQAYNFYDKYIKLGNCKTDAIQWTADEFKVSCSTIYRIIKKLENDN